MRVDRQSSLKSYTPGIIRCVNTGENIYFNKNVLQRFFSFSFLPIDYFSTWYLYLIFWHFFSKLHLKCLTLCKNRWPVKASYCMQTWHGEWCNHVGSDLFGLNSVLQGQCWICLSVPLYMELYSSSLPPTETKLQSFFSAFRLKTELDTKPCLQMIHVFFMSHKVTSDDFLLPEQDII